MPAKTKSDAGDKASAAPVIMVGDKVIFTGDVRYKRPDDFVGYFAVPRKTIIIEVSPRSKHPYRTNFGWVDAKFVTKEEEK